MHDELEADMDAMSSMSESEVQAIMDARERKKQEETQKFLEYRSSLKGEQIRRGSFLTLPPPVQPPAATLPHATAQQPWQSSTSSQMDRLRVPSLRICATQVRAGVL